MRLNNKLINQKLMTKQILSNFKKHRIVIFYLLQNCSIIK